MSRRRARREEREAEVEARSPSPTATASRSPTPNNTSRKRSRSKSRRHDKGPSPPRDDSHDTSPIPPAPAHAIQPPMPPRPLALLVCSLGNPGSTYANTLHSAGHTVLARLAQHLDYPPFTKDRSLGNGLVSRPDAHGEGGGDWTLWQSTSYMNVSGPPILRAWKTWSAPYPAGSARLVVLHDELESPLGRLTVRTTQGASARGHNGLKSLLATLGGVEWVRVGVGIGRPESRASGEVAGYVLRKMSGEERRAVEGCVPGLVEVLKGLEKG